MKRYFKKNLGKSERRLRAYCVSDTILMDMMTTGWRVQNFECIEGVPPTAVYSHVFINPFDTLVYFVFADDSFDIVPVGDDIPICDIKYEVGGA